MKKPETDWVRIEKNHEAIVSEREFALVQIIRIDTRTSPNEEKVYPLSGLVVCGDCGAMMIKRDVPAGGRYTLTISVPDMRLRKRVQHTEYQWVN